MKFKGLCAAGGYAATLAGVVIGALLLPTITGCPISGSSNPIRGSRNVNTNANAGPETPPEILGILNFQSDLAFSDDVTLTVLYSVPADAIDVIGFLQLLNAPFSAGGTPVGIEEIIATDLTPGLNQSYPLDTANLRPGFYRIGVRADDATFQSSGTMEIQGPPAPLFVEPSIDLTIDQGGSVNIVADIGDPQGVARWRLFFQDADAPLNQEGLAAGGELLGQRIAEGSGNTVDVNWDTRNLPIASYRLGLSATDIGLTVAGAVQADRAEAIVTEYSATTVTLQRPPGASLPPTLELLTGNQTAFGGEAVDISFSAETFEGDAYVVTFFSLFNGVRTVFATITDRTVNTVSFATNGLAGGVYSIGAGIDDGKNDLVEVPVASRPSVNVVQIADATLTVSQPGSSVRIAQGADIDIEWSTNVPPGRGTVDVFARQFVSVDNPLGVLGTEVNILSGVSTSVTSATWTTTTERGLFVILVELTITDPPQTDTILATAPGTVRISLTAAQFWIGQIGQGSASTRQGEIFQGVNFQDNAGTFLNAVGDYDNDGRDDFVIGARFGKPFFQNPSGIGIGEAYLVFGDNRRNQTHALNTTGTSALRGVTLTGVRPRGEAQEETDGLSSIRIIADHDGDRLPEMMFGFPFTDSRGHTFALVVRQQPEALVTLEKARQFLRGGVVIVSSMSPSLSNPSLTDQLPPGSGGGPGERAVIFLDLVGQNFRKGQVLETDSRPAGTACAPPPAFTFDKLQLTDAGVCQDGTDDPPCFETFDGPWEGFNRDLADSYAVIRRPFSFPVENSNTLCACFNAAVGIPADPFLAACPLLLGVGGVVDPILSETPTDPVVGSGFYPLRYCTGDISGTLIDNDPRPPFGARIIGLGAGTPGMESTTGDKFGASIASSGEFLLISAPNRQPASGELLGLPDASIPTDPGLVYLVRTGNLWTDWRDVVDVNPDGSLVGTIIGDDRFFFATSALNEDRLVAPPMPYQYQIDSLDQCGRRNDLLERFPSPFKVLGEAGQKIETVEGTPDFNLDGREDFVIGAPLGNSGDGVVYIAYRRDPDIEGDYILSKLSLDPLAQERLAGARINGRAGEGFGEVIARTLTVINDDGSLSNQTVDFNGDGRQDVILGNPNANGGIGEIVVIFSTNDLVTPAGGLDVDALLALNDSAGNPRAIRIAGRAPGDEFGFNVAVVGDFNGDSVNDLLVAAPGASPRFDSNDDGVLDTDGIDVVNLLDPDSEFGDGAADTIAGATDNLLTDAGEVYLILGAAGTYNNLATIAGTRADRTIDITELGTSTFRGMVLVGRKERDQIGGGRETKRNKRSFGIGPAGDVDGDGRADILIGSILADPDGRTDSGEAYLIYGFNL